MRMLPFTVLVGRITKDIYDRKLKQTKERQYEINSQLETLTHADENYHVTADLVLSLAKRSLDIFNAAETSEKRALLNYLLADARVKDKRLDFKLRSPFDAIITAVQTVEKLEKVVECKSEHLELTKISQDKRKTPSISAARSTWLRGWGSNPRPKDYSTGFWTMSSSHEAR
jgi:hypothetical protein